MNISFGLAFIAGILTFFATCLLPLVPLYLAYLGSIAIGSALDGSSRMRVFFHSIVFVVGFLLIFSALGAVATVFGRFVARYRSLFQQIGGAVLIVFGFALLDFVRIPVLSNTYKKYMHPTRVGSYGGSFVFGATFGFAWTPCIGSVLATILFFVSQSGATFWNGALLLAVFGLGLGLPFIVIGLFFNALAPRLKAIGRWSRVMQNVMAVIIILSGIGFMTGHIGILSQWALRWGFSLVI